MKNGNLKSMSVDELWNLHESVVAELTDRIAEERARLEDRLRKLGTTITPPVCVSGVLTRRWFPNIAIQKIVARHGRDVASSRVG